jgi:hypothetical protein
MSKKVSNELTLLNLYYIIHTYRVRSNPYWLKRRDRSHNYKFAQFQIYIYIYIYIY